MKITDALLGEHAVFYAQFGALEQRVPAARTLEEVQALAALLESGLVSHARLENEILFPALEPALGKASGPLAVMHLEHEEIEGGLSRAREAATLETAKREFLHAIEAARVHFAKEERILFPMAAQLLDESTQDRLAAQWSERRNVPIVHRPVFCGHSAG